MTAAKNISLVSITRYNNNKYEMTQQQLLLLTKKFTLYKKVLSPKINAARRIMQSSKQLYKF